MRHGEQLAWAVWRGYHYGRMSFVRMCVVSAGMIDDRPSATLSTDGNTTTKLMPHLTMAVASPYGWGWLFPTPHSCIVLVEKRLSLVSGGMSLLQVDPSSYREIGCRKHVRIRQHWLSEGGTTEADLGRYLLTNLSDFDHAYYTNGSSFFVELLISVIDISWERNSWKMLECITMVSSKETLWSGVAIGLDKINILRVVWNSWKM